MQKSSHLSFGKYLLSIWPVLGSVLSAEGTGKKATVPTFQEELGHLLGKGNKWIRKPCGIYEHCGVTQDCPQGCRGIRKGCLCSSETLQSSILYSGKPWLLRCHPPTPPPPSPVLISHTGRAHSGASTVAGLETLRWTRSLSLPSST